MMQCSPISSDIVCFNVRNPCSPYNEGFKNVIRCKKWIILEAYNYIKYLVVWIFFVFFLNVTFAKLPTASRHGGLKKNWGRKRIRKKVQSLGGTTSKVSARGSLLGGETTSSTITSIAQPPQLVSLDILDMVTEVSVVVGDLLRRADAKASHLGELQKTQAMKFNMVVCKRILAEAEVAMGAFELDFQWE